MGTLDLENFREETRFALENRAADSPSLTEARLNRWINAAYLFVTRHDVYRHPELETLKTADLVVDTISYSVSEIRHIDHVVYTTTLSTSDYTVRRKKLDHTTLREIHDISNMSTGEPTAYAWRGGQVWIDRRPTADMISNNHRLLIYAVTTPTLITNDQVTTGISDDWDEVIIAGAVWYGWLQMGVPDMAEVAKDDFGRMINAIGPVDDSDDWLNQQRIVGATDSMR
jgi:hypothetical protein